MFFDRDQNTRRQRQIAYRNGLKQQIDMKNSKIYLKKQRPSNNEPETFSLLKNIQVSQLNRKKQQQNFYSDLQKQIQFQKQQKKRKKEEEARRQLQQEEKIKRDNQMLRQRAETQKAQQNQKKKGPDQNDQSFGNNVTSKNANRNQPLPLQNKNIGRATNMQQSNLNANRNEIPNQIYDNQNVNSQGNNYYSRVKTSQSQKNDNDFPLQTFQLSNIQQRRAPYPSSLSSIPTYINRVENEPFNFLSQKRYMNSYFEQLLGEKRRFEHEAASISELNRILYQEKSRAGKIQSRGLGELKKLQNMLDQKGANYMSGFSNSRSTNQINSFKKLTVPHFQNSRVSVDYSDWKKLD